MHLLRIGNEEFFNGSGEADQVILLQIGVAIILGLIENMSWMPCPHCGEKIYPFGESGIDEIAARENLPVIAKLPIDPALARACDEGTVEYYEGADLSGLDAVL